MKQSVIHSLAAVLVGLATTLGTAFGDTAEAHVKFLGRETSIAKADEQYGPVNWGKIGEVGVKAFWRSTSTDPKAFVIEGNPNAYGTDGYFCGTSDTWTQEPQGSEWAGALYTGTRSGKTFSGITDYATLKVVNNIPSGEQMLYGDPDAHCDNPTEAIGETISSRVQGGDLFWSFGEPDNVWESSAQDALEITFNELVALHPTIRIGFACSRGDDQDPRTISLRDGNGVVVEGPVEGGSNYGFYHWVFFEISNAAPGEKLTVVLTNREKVRDPGAYSQFASLSIVAFDSVSNGGSEDLPQFTSVAADPDELEIGEDPVETTLSATATDPKGGALTYAWMASGEQPGEYEIGEVTGGACTVTLKGPGDYKFVAKATNEQGLMNFSDIVTVHVTKEIIIPTGKKLTYLGMEVSTANRYSGQPGEYGSKKGAWRSTGTTPKAFVIEGNPNAYGTDGYLYASRSNFDLEAEGSEWKGILYTGTRDRQTVSPVSARFPAITPYASLELLNCGKADNNHYTTGGDDAATMDDPRVPIADSAGSVLIGADIVWGSFPSETQSEVEAMRITFNENVADRPIVRIGFVTDRFCYQNPAEITVRDSDGRSVTGEVKVVGDNDWGYINWTFFEVLNAEPGDVLTVSIKNASSGSGWSTWTMLNTVAFDSHFAGSNDEPVIESVSATPADVVYDNWKAETTLAVVASDADGDVLSYAWESVGTPPNTCTFETPNAATCKVSMSGAGTYQFRVSVTDGKSQPVYSDPVTVTVTKAPDAAYAEFVGAEATLTPGPNNGYDPMIGEDAKNYPWGTPADGNKCSYRSLAAGNGTDGCKAFVFKGRPNAYGLDGYAFLGYNEVRTGVNERGENVFEDVGPISSGTIDTETLVVSNATDYLTAICFNKDAIMYDRDGFGRRGCYYIDDPRLPLADWVEDIRVGWMAFRCQPGSFTRLATLEFGRRVARHERIRVGIFCGFGEGWRPVRLSVGGVAHDWVQVNGDYCRPDWQFFDLVGVKPGDRVDILAMGSAADKLALDGIVFDSTPPKSGLMVIIR